VQDLKQQFPSQPVRIDDTTSSAHELAEESIKNAPVGLPQESPGNHLAPMIPHLQPEGPLPATPADQHGLHPQHQHPLLLLDPRPETFLAVTQLRRLGIPVGVLTSRRLEPAFYAREVNRHRLPAVETHPERWEACLVEMAARLEPRPILIPCSRPATRLIRALHPRLAPHYAMSYLHSLAPEGIPNAPTAETALRRAVLRGEPAMEVQVTLDAQKRCTGSCVLTWTAGAHPDVIVASTAGEEILENSLAWLRERSLIGYARLVWAPDRFGRMVIHAASALPGIGWSLALSDGVDFPALWYAALVGRETPPQVARMQVSRRIAIAEPGTNDDALPLAQFNPPWAWRDPLPWFAGFLCSLVRR